MNDQNIRELALEAAQGSTPAFQELYRLTRQGAWFVALSIAKNEHDAQDILQESYLKAFKSMGQLVQPESFVPWLNQIVANKAKNYIARKKPDSFAQYEDENAQDWQEETDPAFIPDEHLDQAEAKALIAALVNELPEDQRLVVLLHYYDDMEVASIAKSLEIPEGTVKSRLSRARLKLAAMLQQAQGKGLRLYAVAPIPLLAYFIKLLGFDAPGSDRLPPLLIGTAAAGTAAAGGAAAAGASAAKKAPLVLGKAAALAAAVVVTVGGLSAAGIYAYNKAAAAAAHAPATDTYSESHAASNQFPALSLPDPSQVPAVTRPELSGADTVPGGNEAQRNTAASTAGAAQTERQPTVAAATSGTTTTTAAPTTPKPPYTTPLRTTRPRTTRERITIPKPEPTTETTTTTELPIPIKEYDYTVSGGFLTITKYNGAQTSITIPAQIDGMAVHHLETSAFAGTNLTHVKISSGIDCVRANTFANCPGLVEIIIPSSVVNIWPNAFNGSPNVVMVCEEGSTAHDYAVEKGIDFTLV